MYQSKIYVNDILNKMNHVFERFTYLSRSKSFKKEQVDQIDYHLNEIMKILNECN
jgi:D-lyxose ketol-isomerase